MSDAASIAKALRGHRSGDGWLCRCPVPSHGKGKGDRNPSLFIKDGDVALLVTCFGNCEERDVLDALRRRGLLANDRRADQRPWRSTKPAEPLPEPDPDPRALSWWRRGLPPSGTLVERYLREHRNLGLDLPPSLRFLPEAVHPGSDDAIPAMIAAFQRPDRKICACQLAYLQPNGSKSLLTPPRLTIGRMGTGAVHLAPAGNVIGLAEGVETALAAMEMSGVPTWAVLGARRLSVVTIPDVVREIHVFTDNDAPGRAGAEKAAARFTAQGRRVVLRAPPDDCKDWNDFLKARAGSVAA